MPPDPKSFYVFKRGDRLVSDRYHRGTCPWVKGLWKKSNIESFKSEHDAKYFRKEGHLEERSLCEHCKEAEAPSKPSGAIPKPTKVNVRIPEGSKYFGSTNGFLYHTYAKCKYLDQERKGGHVYGFTTLDDALHQDTDHETRLSHKRIQCISFDRREKGDTCFGHSPKLKPKPSTGPRPRPASKPQTKPGNRKRTVSLDLWTTAWLIKPEIGEGANNLKFYGFRRAFFSRDKLSGATAVRKLEEFDFSENWLIKLPVSVELEGDFEIAPLPKSIPRDSPQEMRERSTIVLKGRGQNPPRFTSATIVSVPPAIGPKRGRLLYNTAGYGEAHGDSGESKFIFKGVRLSTEGRPLRSGKIRGLGRVSVDYFYSLDYLPEPWAAFSFSLGIEEEA